MPKRGDVVAVRLHGDCWRAAPCFSIRLTRAVRILFELGSIVSAPRVDGRVTPGVDAAVAQMRAGEVGRLIVPYDAGYGPGLSLYGTRKAGSRHAGSRPARRSATRSNC